MTKNEFGFVIKIFLYLLPVCGFVLISTSSSFGNGFIQNIEIPSSINPVGSGGRALGMGGAFIAIADDATAASWNPAGLIQLETPEVSVVGAAFFRTENNSFGLNPEASGKQDVDRTDLNYLSLAYPFTYLNRNMIVSLNYQKLYDFNRSWNFIFNTFSEELNVSRDEDFKQTGDLYAWGLAYAIQVTPTLSLGITFNFWEDGIANNGWEKTTDEKGNNSIVIDSNTLNFSSTYYKNDKYSFSGFNCNFGLLWNMSPKWTIGAVLKTPFSADIKYSSFTHTTMTFPDYPAMDDNTTITLTDNQKLDMPMSYGIGIAYRFSDSFTMSFDVYRTQWKDFILEDSEGNKTNPITGKDATVSGLKSTNQVRMGAEYLYIGNKYIIPVRGGVFFDPAPAENDVDNYFGAAIGTGIVYKRFVFDVAYQYRFGHDVGKSFLKDLEFSQDMHESTVYSSAIFYF